MALRTARWSRLPRPRTRTRTARVGAEAPLATFSVSDRVWWGLWSRGSAAAAFRGNSLVFPLNFRPWRLPPSSSSLCPGVGRAAFSPKAHGVSAAGDVDGGEMDLRTVYGVLKLSRFTRREFDWRFDRIARAGDGPDDERRACEPSAPDGSPTKSGATEEEGEGRGSGADRGDGIRLRDMEAYLFGRYRRIEDRRRRRDAGDAAEHEQGGALAERIRRRAEGDAAAIFRLLLENVPGLGAGPDAGRGSERVLSKDQFRASLVALSSRPDYRAILPLAASMLLVGSSVGVVSPIMPFVAESLSLTSTQYGMVVSSFALSKMAWNVPSAVLVERHGRRPYLVHPLWLVGLGVAGMGVCADWTQLCACRMTVGMGVAALTTASALMVADVSTPLSRASTFSPIMSAFAAGMALGPAVGGMLHDAWGMRNTFFAVGLSYSIAAAWNHTSVSETRRTEEWWEGNVLPWDRNGPDASKASVRPDDDASSKSSFASTVSHAIKDTAKQWSSLLDNERVRPILIMNGFYMFALSGTQFTLLPLILTGGGVAASAGASAGLALSASAVGQLYMGMSAVQVLGNPAAGRFADRAGKGSAIVVGGALTSLAMAAVPVVCAYASAGGDALDVNWPLLAGTLGAWSLGGTLLATSHVAAVSDVADDAHRSQALALLRTAGDVGYLCGAVGAGLAADLAGDVGAAMQGGGAVLAASTAWFGWRTLGGGRRT